MGLTLLISIIVAAIAMSVMDTIQFHYSKSIFKGWKEHWTNPAISWRNKYKNGDPEQGAKFIGSTTVFVWVTDLWHFAQEIMLLAFILPIILHFTTHFISGVILYFIIKFVFALVFELFYRHILVKPKN